MKDPAFLFYPGDFLVGTMTMSFEDKGKYITILSMMHQQGRINEETIRFLVGSISDNLRNKFSIDDKAFWFNERLENEIEKRANFTESRRINGSKGGRPKDNKPSGLANGKPKKNLPEDVNINVNIDKVYNLYPSKCPIKDSSTGKSGKSNKDKIRKLLSEYSVDELEYKINWYVEDCKKHKVYLKNFATFLNNLPDTDLSHSLPDKQRLPLWRCTFRAAPTRDYECETKEEAATMYYNFGGTKPENIERIR